MSLNIKNPRTHALVRRLAEVTHQSQTSADEDAVRRRLDEIAGEQGKDARFEAPSRSFERLGRTWTTPSESGCGTPRPTCTTRTAFPGDRRHLRDRRADAPRTCVPQGS